MHKFLEEIAESMRECMEECIRADMNFANDSYETECGVIEIYTNKKNEVEVVVCHYDNRERESTNIEQAVQGVIPDWNEVYNEVLDSVSDEWNEHGFRDAVDFETYKFGHGGLR